MPNRQVRLDPDVCGWIEGCAYDYDISLSATVNKLLRALRDEPPQPVRATVTSASTSTPPVPVPQEVPVGHPAPTAAVLMQRRAQPVKTNVSPRALALLRENAAQ